MKKSVGSYKLGYNNIRLYVDPAQNGGIFTDATSDGLTEVTVGLDYPHWYYVMNVVMHELTELAITDMGCRYSDGGWSAGSDKYKFFLDHNQFSEAITRAASVIAEAIPKIAAEYKKSKKAKEAKDAKRKSTEERKRTRSTRRT